MSQIKVEVDFLEFIKTGVFGFLKLGETKEEIENQGLLPENWLNGESKDESRILRYGNIEFHFENKNNLSEIYTDYLSNIDGGKSISISNWWIISNDKVSPSLLSTIGELNSLNLDYTKITYSVGYIDIELPNGVYFSFDCPEEKPYENQNCWTMTTIGKRINKRNM
ncbi:MAG: hypothetical protein ACJAWV_004458 [Flammeovirgaceae bacterium]|jgi:hypothetical protein